MHVPRFRDTAIPLERYVRECGVNAAFAESTANERKANDSPSRPPRPLQTASATYDPLCEFVNPMLDAENKLNCGGDYA